MAGLIAKQPNGKYMRISTVVDAPTHWNMSKVALHNYLVETDQFDYFGQTVNEWMQRYGVHFGEALDHVKTTNMTEKEIADWIQLINEKSE